MPPRSSYGFTEIMFYPLIPTFGPEITDHVCVDVNNLEILDESGKGSWFEQRISKVLFSIFHCLYLLNYTEKIII